MLFGKFPQLPDIQCSSHKFPNVSCIVSTAGNLAQNPLLIKYLEMDKLTKLSEEEH